MSTGTNNWSGRRQPRWGLGLVALVAIARSFGGVDSQPVFAQSVPAGQEQVNSGASADDSAFLFSGRAPADVEQLKVLEQRSGELMTELLPAIVNVQVGAAQGSGVVVSRDGYVLTAAHVIGRQNLNAKIKFPDGREVNAKTLGMTRGVDSGMLKITDPGNYPYVEVGESGDLKNGQWLLAIGHPGGWDEKRGLVLRVGRLLYKNPTVLRTDCVLVGGDSGGPLFDFEGRVVGIHSRIGNALWDNFHVPVDSFSEEWDQLVAGKIVGASTKAYIGLSLSGDTNQVSEVAPGSPADQAGVKKDDRIIKMDGKPVKDKASMGEIFRELKIGQKVELVVQRGELEITMQLEVGEN
ncbi:MAG: S1C family serine protease [Planctomycetota bacterium]